MAVTGRQMNSSPVSSSTLARKLATLLETGTLPASALGSQARRTLTPLFEAGILEETRSGSGRSIKVRDHDALMAFSRKLFPSGLDSDALFADSLPRAGGILAMRDSKNAASTWAEPVLLRGFDHASLAGPSGNFPVAQLTETAGLCSIRLDEPFRWGFSGRLAVAENLEFFLSFENTGISCDLVLYSAGRLSCRVIKWLASPLMAKCSVLHCGDYDPAGLQEFIRLWKNVGERVTLYVPENLEDLVKQYGKPELLNSQRHLLPSVRSCANQQVREVCNLLEQYSMGLEQEVLLLT